MLQVRNAEVVIVGSGVAGLSAALQLSSQRVVVLTKTAALASGSSPLAQGGIAAALGAEDSPQQHAADTVAAGAGLVNPVMAQLLAQEGITRVQGLLDWGLPADRSATGELCLGREAAHGHARIVHAGGDGSGHAVVQTLLEQVQEASWIEVYTESFAVDLVMRNGQVCGVLAREADRWVWWRCSRVVLATGGIGTVFRYTTNPSEATGDGLAMAARAGAELADLEFMQFHPTALAVKDAPGGRLPLLTEALRGDGARLVDGNGAAMMAGVHPLGDLAPRAVVASAVWQRVAAGDTVYLDLRPALAAHPDGFPTVLRLCGEAGFDPFRAPVPVIPAAHYHMGGVRTDEHGRSSLQGLWACGEVACTGVHGANRLASNSLLEGLVFGARVAADIQRCTTAALPLLPLPTIPSAAAGERLADLAQQGREAIYAGVGLERDAAGIDQAAEKLAQLTAELEQLPTAIDEFANVRRWGETRNLLLIGRLLAAAAWQRQESRGAHYRSDFPSCTAHGQQQVATLAQWLAGGVGHNIMGDQACFPY